MQRLACHMKMSSFHAVMGLHVIRIKTKKFEDFLPIPGKHFFLFRASVQDGLLNGRMYVVVTVFTHVWILW